MGVGWTAGQPSWLVGAYRCRGPLFVSSTNETLPLRPSLERLTARYEPDHPKLRLDPAACRYFACKQDVAADSLEGLGPVVTSPGPRIPLGSWLAIRARQGTREGFWGLALDDCSWVDAVHVRGEVTMFLDRPATLWDDRDAALIHTMRNQLSAIQINAEVLAMFAQAYRNDEVGKPAARVLNNANLLRESMEESVQHRVTCPDGTCDLGATLKSNFYRRSGSEIAFDHSQVPVSLAYCSSLMALMMQWLAFGSRSDQERGPIRLTVDPEAETIRLESGGLNSWVAHSLSGMVDWLGGCDASIAPTRVFLDTGLGCGYWRDGRYAGAEIGYHPESR
jgi:hypothetical protein